MSENTVTISEARFVELLRNQRLDPNEWTEITHSELAALRHAMNQQQEPARTARDEDADKWRQRQINISLGGDTMGHIPESKYKQMVKDAELGALVRQMHIGTHLTHTVEGTWVAWSDNPLDRQLGVTPEESLRAALEPR